MDTPPACEWVTVSSLRSSGGALAGLLAALDAGALGAAAGPPHAHTTKARAAARVPSRRIATVYDGTPPFTGGFDMLAQLRIYTINKGEMNAFLKHFHDEVRPLHEKVGLPIASTYVNRPQNEFIWVRTFTDEADREAKQKAFRDAAGAAGVELGGTVATMEIRDIEP